jgi:hypothetical protein
MDKSFLQVDYKTTINIVAKKAMQRTIDKIYDFITIIKEDRYYGTVTVVCVDSKEYESSYELSEDIGRLKKECKQQAGSFCNICNL